MLSKKVLQILLLSPYHGGSHHAWATGWQMASQHAISLLTLPDRFWKWRMHGGAVTLARRFLAEDFTPDLIVATDMLDLTTFLALTRLRTANIPTAVYMHENQLTYPLPADGRFGPMRRQLGERDLHYAFINYVSMLAADRVFFNSNYHFTSFYTALPNFLKHFPEYNELGSMQTLQDKSQILPPGVDFQRLEPAKTTNSHEAEPLIVWNQRWEYDKNPEAFFTALYAIADEGIDFRLALCGQQFGQRPSAFARALDRLGPRIVHTGHAKLPDYRRLLWEADLTISTAHHEFFGISLLEAIYCHTFPLLPSRLSYPELLPASFQPACFYENEADLVKKLRWALTHLNETRQTAASLATAVQHFDWRQVAPSYDAHMKTLWKKSAACSD